MLKFTHPITGAEVQVGNQDFSDRMNWEDAKRACNELGDGWRLPTKEELKAMHDQLHKKGHGNFESDGYWSNTEVDIYLAWYFDFTSGAADYYDKDHLTTYYVRAVRAL
jgi:hypothetical protein